MEPKQSRHTGSWHAFALLALIPALAGCPKMKMKTVELAVKTPCPVPTTGPSTPSVSVRQMVTVGTIQAGEREKAVLAGCSYAAVVAVGEKVGSEQGDVTGIATNGVTVRMPDTTSILVKKTDTIPSCDSAANGGESGTTATAAAALSKAELAALRELELWRTSVANFVTRGYGIPVDVLLVLSIATMPNKPPAIEALAKLGWTPAAGIDRTVIERLSVEDGRITATGSTPNRAAFEALLKRLQTSNPLLTRVKVISSAPRNGGFGFEIGIEAPLIPAREVAIPGNPTAEKPLPDDMEARLSKASAKLPKSADLGEFESDIKALAGQSGLEVTGFSRLGAPITEGWLGMVTIEMKANGSAQGLITWLAQLRQRGAEQNPVLIDPLVVRGSSISATIRIPFIAGKADARAPAPPAVYLPSLSSERWSPARSIPVPTLRDPFAN